MQHEDHAPRILAGDLRGRKLEVAPGKTTRPLKALARRSLFDSIQDRIPGARVLDVFAGTGAIAFEALSRGASHATLVEAGRPALSALHRNVATLGLRDRVTLLAQDAVTFAPPAGTQYDWIYLGPPFPFFRGPARPQLLALLARTPSWLASGGLLVLETPNGEPEIALPPLLVERVKDHGASVLTHYVAGE